MVLRRAHQCRVSGLSQPDVLARLQDMDPSSAHRRGLMPPSERVWQEFLAALDELPPDARAVLLLHDVLGAGFDDIVPLLGLDLSACRRRLEQARACLQAHGDHLEPGTP
ncbi:sigma factor-like helix-turn-helix DNA-binding protein [Stenotrophomonas tumulicola]|uniref:Transcriptional regulator n=1 Tax=Stenotrophomonas tumulicola TaxID=1685415 RepID=A0A7W3IIA5_9GAMM|nr:sigma-70 region 4 domain-containing protein [Stenotrophomonas tumulicola]MBA8681454.1 transcriptional regulator [Stenotrophomonas tumulicola]